MLNPPILPRASLRGIDGLEVDKVLQTMRMLTVLLFLCIGSGALAQQRVLTIEEATHLALESNPEVRMLAGNVDAARARLAGASLLLQHNPTVSTAAGPRSDVSGESLDYSVGFLQQIEIGGQRGIRLDAAEAALDTAQAQLQAIRVEVSARVQERFGHALAAEKRAQLAHEAFAIAQQGLNAAEERFSAGAATLLETNTARVELGRVVRQRADADRALAEGYADLHLLVGLDPLQAFTVTGELGGSEPLGEPDTLVREALTNRAEVRAGIRELDTARAEALLASRERIPSPRLGASYSREEGSDSTIIQGMLAFDLPLFNRNTASRGVAAARIDQLGAALEATNHRITQEVLTALTRLRAARTAAEGYAGDVVKAMQENLELVTESYQAGKIDFLQLVIIRRQAVEARREYIDVLEDLNAADAQLNQALGRSRR